MRENLEKIRRKTKERWDKIAKPIDSLGKLEAVVCKLCAIGGSEKPYDLSKKALVIFCADHGVVAEGVTQTDSSVTKAVAENFALGKSTVNKLSENAGVHVFTFDIGMDTEEYPETEIITGRIINRKIRRATGNLYKEAAMTMEECLKAIETGKEIVRSLKKQGYKIIATGEMGIGNTTPTSVLASLLLHIPAEEVTGKGAGLSASGLNRKREVVAESVRRIQNKYGSIADVSENNSKENMYLLNRNLVGRETVNNVVLNYISEGGGLEIAGMVGVFLGGMEEDVPIVIDGAISAVAALCAATIDERCKDYMFASHMPLEKGGANAIQKLALEPLIYADLCLGEGSGAIMVMPLFDMAMKVYKEMGSFEDYNIGAYERFVQ